MRELFVGTKSAEDECGTSHCFGYYISIGEIETGAFSCESYGVKIIQHGTETVGRVDNITTSASRIDGLIDLLMRNVVSPQSLRDVIEDWL